MLHGRPLLQRLIGNSLWQVGDKVFRMGAGVLVSAYTARYLGPANFGLLNFAVAFVTLFSAIAAFGLPSIVVRDLVMRPAERSGILASALLLRLAGGAATIALAVATTARLRPDDFSSLQVVFVIALCTLPQAWDVIDYDYQARIHARPIIVARNLSFAAMAAARVCLVLIGAPLVWFAWAILGEAVLAASLMIRQSHAEGMGISPRTATWQEVGRLATSSWPLIIAGVSVSVYMRLDQVMLGQMLGDSGVGLFSAAVRISEALYFLPVAVAVTVAPALTRAYHRSTEEYEHRFLQITSLLVWIALATAAVFAVFSKVIIRELYGPAYAGAAPVLAIHAWAGVLASLGVCGNLWLTNAGYVKYAMYQTFAGAVVNILLNLVLIRHFGVIGAALATCAAQVACVLVTVATFRATRPLFRLQLAAFVPRFAGGILRR